MTADFDPEKVARDAAARAAGATDAKADDNEALPQRERIVEAVLAAGVTIWRDADANAFATVPLDPAAPDAAVMYLDVRSRRFALKARQLFGEANPVTGARGARPGGVSDSAMKEAIPSFEAMALAAQSLQPGVRLLAHGDAIWLDLGDDTYRAIRVMAAGWTVETRAGAPLIRPDGIRALPSPVRGAGALDTLRRLLNISDDAAGKDAFRLVVAWLVAALHPIGPYAVLAVDGEQGSGKSTTCRMLRRLVDPNIADLRAPPRTEDDLLIAALNGSVVALDNVSYIEPWLADALCRLATGGGFSKRKLYADLGEVTVAVSRPILLNGIPSLLARGDLADRSIAITLPPIPDAMRRPESKVWQAFEAAAPGILALLLDGLAMALRRLPTLELEMLPRMADFARLACAAAPAFGWTEADMLAALERNREASVATVIEADALAEAVRALANDRDTWEGSPTKLLEEVNLKVSLDISRERGWPKDAARLSARLKRVAPALRRAGVEVVLPTGGGRNGRTIVIRPADRTKQRSERSERSSTPQDIDLEQNTGNACGNDERSRNAGSVPERSANPLKYNDRNGGNAGNADLSDLGDLNRADDDEATI